MTNAVLANGTTITIGGHPVDDCTGVSGLSYSAETVDVTPVGAEYKEYLAGQRGSSKLTVEFNWTGSTAHEFIRDSRGVESECHVVMPDTTEAVFMGFVEAFSLDASSGTALKATATISMGAISWGAEIFEGNTSVLMGGVETDLNVLVGGVPTGLTTT